MNNKMITLLIGEGTSNFGNYLFTLSTNWYLYKLTHNSVVVGVMSAITVFIMLFNIVTGFYADHHYKINIMIAIDLIQFVLMIIATYIFSSNNYLSLKIMMIVILTIFLGTFFSPAEDALIPQLVSKRELKRANSYNQSIIAISQISGLVIGGILAAFVTISAFMLINGVTFLISLICLILLKNIHHEILSKQDHQYKGYSAGVKFVLHNSLLKKMLIIALFANFALGPLSGLDVVWNTSVLHASSMIYGTSQTVLLVGIILGSILANFVDMNLKSLLGITILVIGIIMTLLSLQSSIIITLIMFIIIGASIGILNTSVGIIFQVVPPKNLIGRANGVIKATSILIMPFGIILGSILANFFTIQISFFSFGLLIIIIGLLTLYLKNSSLQMKISKLIDD